MGILDNQQPQQPPAEFIAAQIKQQAKTTYQQLLQVFNNGSRQFWKNPRATPQEISAALGTDATEVFQLHGKIGALLASINPSAIATGSSVVGQFEYNADGSVTVLGASSSESM